MLQETAGAFKIVEIQCSILPIRTTFAGLGINHLFITINTDGQRMQDKEG